MSIFKEQPLDVVNMPRFLNGLSTRSFHQDRGGINHFVDSVVLSNILSTTGKVYQHGYHGYTNEDNVNKILKQVKPLLDNIGINILISECSGYGTDYYFINDSSNPTASLILRVNIGKAPNKLDFKCLSFEHKSHLAIKKFIQNNCKEDIVKPSKIFAVGQGNQGLTLQTLGTLQDNFNEIKNNYMPGIIDQAEYVIDEYNKDVPAGRLTIINGKPGGGKTFLVRSMIPQLKKGLVILLPIKLVGTVDGPALVSLLSNWREEYLFNLLGNDDDISEKEEDNPPIIFILEDADECLVQRAEGDASTIAALLNYTDGIFGSMMDIRVIATTNAEHIEFDDAFKRPGRLCSHIFVPELNAEKANEIYKRVAKKEESPYKGNTTLATVYADAQGYQVKEKKKTKKVGFGI